MPNAELLVLGSEEELLAQLPELVGRVAAFLGLTDCSTEVNRLPGLRCATVYNRPDAKRERSVTAGS